jgi:predicted PurR-regulated permease PerM
VPKKIEISHRTIIFVAVFCGLLWVGYQIKDILFMLLVAVMIMSALNPVVDALEGRKIPRIASISLLFIFLWGVIGGMIAGLVPTLIDQTSKLITKIPGAFEKIELFGQSQSEITQQILSRISTLPEVLFKIIFDFLGNMVNVLTTLVVTFYLLLERKDLDKYLLKFLGEIGQKRVMEIVKHVENSLGIWFRGEFILMLAVGIMTYLGLLFLGVESALPLAILAGILEIVPNIGPIISAIPAILVAFTISPLLALGTAALYFIVQWLENNLLVPNVMRRMAGLSPIVVILGLMIGFRLGGTVGAVLAVPIIIVIRTIWNEYYNKS